MALPAAGGYGWRMDFIDVPGASGAAYRFRSADLNQLPPTAGNLVVVAGPPARRRYVACGAARSLNEAAPAVKAVLADCKGARLFVRLNVARTIREAEHADIAAAVQPEADLPDLD